MRSIAALAGTVLLTACSVGAPPAALDGRTFVSTAVTQGGEPFELVPDTEIRLTFTDGNLSASAGCNTIGGTYRLDGGTLVFEGGGMTEMGCDPERHAQDDWLSELLGSRPSLSLAGNELGITAGDTVISLVDREIAEPDLPLIGPLWTVDSLFSGDAVSSLPDGAVATLQFADDGTLEINAGCNTGSGRYTVDGSTMSLGDVVLTDMACAGAGGELEEAVLRVLSAGDLDFSIDAGSLTIMAGDVGLGLRGS